MEIHVPDLIHNWRVSVIGTFVQVIASIMVIWLFGHYFNWNIRQVILLGFVISLSSTAVVVKLVEEKGELNTSVGKNVLSILLAQDILIVPMMVVIGYMGGSSPSRIEMIKQIVGGLLVLGIIFYIIKLKHIKLPFQKYIRLDHELQVFVAFSLCFGFSILTAFFGLSAALGAFVAGIIISSARSTAWVFSSLHAFKIMFVALFFVSVGMLIDLGFLKENILLVVLLLASVFVLNNTINLFAIKLFCLDWKGSIYAASLLSQIGEFSFILISAGYFQGIVGEFMYQLIISTIALSLLLSPLWIAFTRRITRDILPGGRIIDPT